MLEIKTIFDENIPIITLSGRLDGYGATLLESQIASIEATTPHWILDCTDVHFLSSAGIRILLKTEKSLRNKRGSLLIAGMKEEIVNILALTGLINQFTLVVSADEAISNAKQYLASEEKKEVLRCGEREYTLHELHPKQCLIDIWNKKGCAYKEAIQQENLIPTNLAEFGLGFGIGGFGISASQAEESIGLLIGAGKFSGLSPADGHNHPDFMITEKPIEAQIYIAQGISFSGKPTHRILSENCNASLRDVIEEMYQKLCPKDNESAIIGFCLLVHNTQLHAAKLSTPEDLAGQHYTALETENDSVVFIQGIYINEERISQEKEHKNLIVPIFLPDAPERVYMLGCVLQDGDFGAITDLDDMLRKIDNIEHLKDIVRVRSDSIISSFNGWFFVPENIRDAEEKRLVIETAGDETYNPEWDTIIRRIYSECSRIELNQLHGGFTSIAFQVTSYDKDRRKLLPTVLKIGSIRNTENEVEAYHKYVEKFILNNSTTIMGTTRYKQWAGLRYNFVGINGTESTLCWLTDYYKKHTTEKLLPLFDRIFTDVLKPWYGQPRWEHIYPYSQHSPLTLFTNLFETLEKEQQISPEDEKLYIEELKKEIINPYYFLKHEYPRRQAYSKLWYRAINHGDLNMQNILLDEKENIYVIDFSETKPRNIVSDFARLEPIFKIEMCNFDSKEELTQMLEFEEGLLQIDLLNQKPPFIYHGNDPMVKKAHTMICRLRDYANTVTLFEKDLIPYLLALLDWTFPVICYTQLSDYKKRLAVYSAALMCEKILKLEKEKDEKI